VKLVQRREVIQDQFGTRQVGARVLVKTPGGTAATIYADQAGTQQIAGGVVLTDENAEFSFWYRDGSTLLADVVVGVVTLRSGVAVTPPVSTVSLQSIDDMRAITPAAGLVVNLVRDGVPGVWVYYAGNYVAEVAADTTMQVYAPLTSDPTGALGVFKSASSPYLAGGIAAPSVSALGDNKPTSAVTRQLVDGGRSGVFRAVFGDFTARCAADPRRAIYVPFAADSTPGASGAFVREWALNSGIYAGWFGLGMDPAVDDTAAMNAFIDFARQTSFRIPGSGRISKVSLHMPGGGGIYVADTLNFTFMPSHQLYFYGSTIYSRAGGKVALDCSGAQAMHWHQPRLVCSTLGGEIPTAGVRVARVDDPDTVYAEGDYERNPSPFHKFDQPIFSGAASVAMYLNVGSEHNTIFAGEIINSFAGVESRDPATMTVAVAVDNYNEMGVRAPSTLAPLSTPFGYRNGTQHNHSMLGGTRIVANGANGTPCYFNGPRGMRIENGFMLTTSGVGVVWGDGGYGPSAGSDGEQLNDNNYCDFHTESAGTAGNTDLPVSSMHHFRANNRSVKVSRLVWTELHCHANDWIIDKSGTYPVRFENCAFLPDSVLNSNSNCRFFNPAYKTHFSGSGVIGVEPTPDVQRTLQFTTTAGVSRVTINYKKHGQTVGDKVDLRCHETGGPLLAVDGIVLQGMYPITAVVDANAVTIDTFQMPTTGGITGDAANGEFVSVRLTNPKILDFASCISHWNGVIQAGDYAGLVQKPGGNVHLQSSFLGADVFMGDRMWVGGAAYTGTIGDATTQCSERLPTRANLNYNSPQELVWAIAVPGRTVPANGEAVYTVTSGVADIQPTDALLPPAADLGAYAGNTAIVVSAQCVVANQVLIRFSNRGGSDVTIPAGTFYLQALRPGTGARLTLGVVPG